MSWIRNTVLPYVLSFSGGWGAGYYSHLWSRMLAADIFSAYLEAGWDNPDGVARISGKISETFLSAGSAVPTALSFRQFRGRDPNPEALLLSLGTSFLKSVLSTLIQCSGSGFNGLTCFWASRIH
jgi:oligopeptidase A